MKLLEKIFCQVQMWQIYVSERKHVVGGKYLKLFKLLTATRLQLNKNFKMSSFLFGRGTHKSIFLTYVL